MTEAETGIVDSRALRPGMVVGGKFALLRRIGEGGVGVVFEAEDTWIGRRVALKVLHSHLLDHAEILARFRREARAAAMTNHPNIVAVYEVGRWHDGAPYIVQELLLGETLRERLIEGGRLPPAEAIEILVPIIGALAVAHRAGIVHRDIKPENIFLSRVPGEGGGETIVPKLIDFGIAKIPPASPAFPGAAIPRTVTLTGTLVGTPMYMSPEQASGGPPDSRTDVWAMGAVMYELLSDHLPYEGASSAVILGKILTQPLTPLPVRAPDLPPELVAVVHKALEREPSRRFASMEEFLAALLAYATKPDPTVSARHARSIPPASEEPATLARPGLRVAEPAPAQELEPVPLPLRSTSEWARPIVQPELGWYEQRSGRARRDAGWYAAAAGQALQDNALEEAVDHAEHAVEAAQAEGEASTEMVGKMRLVQAIAQRWLGHYADAERCALAAAEALPRRSPGWYTALGHVAIIGGSLGKNERFPAILAELSEIEGEGARLVSAQHVIAACRLSVSLVRAGLAERASRALASARAAAEPHTEEEPMVRAWIFVAVAELAMHAGDPAGYLRHLESSVTCFSEAGDVRNACLQRANIGNAYMQLGAYARAKGLLRESLAVGEPLKLGFIAPVRANLGLVLARLGDVQQALEMENTALEQCIRERHRRFEVASRIYLATILAMRGETERAEEELRAAIAGSASTPAIRAYAQANLADQLFSEDRPEEARAIAEEAMATLLELEGVEEGESQIRLQHALALEAAGDAAGAAAAALEARRRLLERADRINDPRLRRSFLDHIPENARTLALASRYKPAR